MVALIADTYGFAIGIIASGVISAGGVVASSHAIAIYIFFIAVIAITPGDAAFIIASGVIPALDKAAALVTGVIIIVVLVVFLAKAEGCPTGIVTTGILSASIIGTLRQARIIVVVILKSRYALADSDAS